MKTDNKIETDGIILDIDGTIWNTTEVVAVAWNRVIDNLGWNIGKVCADQLKKEFGKTMDVIAMDLWPELSKEQQKQLMDLCCIEEQKEIEANTRNITYESVVDTIKELSQKVSVYIVSNCQDGYVELVMKKTCITPCIKDFECFGRTGKGKADNLKLICERNGIKKPVYIGDTAGDEEACKQAGIPFVWASYGFGNPENYVAKLDSFSQIKNCLS